MDTGANWAGLLYLLKQKLKYFVIIAATGFGIAWFLADYIILRIKSDLLPIEANLIVTTPIEYIMVKIQIALILGILLLLPFLVYWITKRFDIKIVKRKSAFVVWSAAALILFLIGFSFSYFLLLPVAIKILTSFTTEAGVLPYFSISSFMIFVVLTMLIFSLIFELPLVVTWLAINRIVYIETLKERRRYVYVGIFVLDAIITADPTPVSQILLSLPLILLYEASIVVARIFVKGK